MNIAAGKSHSIKEREKFKPCCRIRKKSTLHSTFQSIGMRAIFFQHEISTFPLRLTFEKFFFSDSANGRSVSLCFNIESCCSQKKLACWRSECELIFFYVCRLQLNSTRSEREILHKQRELICTRSIGK